MSMYINITGLLTKMLLLLNMNMFAGDHID